MLSFRNTVFPKVMRRAGYLAIGAMLAMFAASTFSSAAVEADGRVAPPLSGATHWFNSEPLSDASLRGKVVLVDFWTYSCSNCLNALPHVKDWDRKYRAGFRD